MRAGIAGEWKGGDWPRPVRVSRRLLLATVLLGGSLGVVAGHAISSGGLLHINASEGVSRLLMLGISTGVEHIAPMNSRDASSATDEMDGSRDVEVRLAAASTSGEPWLSDEVRWFNGRPVRPVRTIRMTVTAYSPDERSCGPHADGITASGYSVWTNAMKLAAADTSVLPFGSLVSIPGYDGGRIVPVLDRGGAIKGNRLDVLYPTHAIARKWGVQELEVTVWEYADGAANGFRTSHR